MTPSKIAPPPLTFVDDVELALRRKLDTLVEQEAHPALIEKLRTTLYYMTAARRHNLDYITG